MRPFLTGERFGNPSGSHAVARAARTAVDEARDVVAECLGCKPGEVVFTGSGTEADNLAILGVHAVRPGRVLCSSIEHHAVLHAVESVGGTVIELDRLDDVLGPDVVLVSVMLVNNEVGTIQPLDEVVERVRRVAPDALVHTDAVQAFSWVDVAATSADLVAVSAHKFGGPQGVGALVVREGLRIVPLLHGGGQERERRSGTHNVAGIVGMAAAMRATVDTRATTNERVARLRDRLADGLLATVPGAVETGGRARKVAGNCHLRFLNTESEALLLLLDEQGVYASAGSACASGAIEPSHVLTAMGIEHDDALSAVRFSLGYTSTEEDVDLALRVVPPAVERLRA